MGDWYRKETWTKEDEKDFFLHLAKSRGEYNKAQYLKIQAFTLYETHKKKYFDAILTLLDKYFNDFPNENNFKCECLHLYGRVFYDMKTYDKAFDYFQKAAYLEAEFPDVISGAWLDYAQIIIRLKRVEQYDEAERFIQMQDKSLLFPIQIYRANAVLAIIHNFRGEQKEACRHKSIANQAALVKEPVFRKLGKIGLVSKKDPFLEKAMRKIKSPKISIWKSLI